ncbi:MAG: hypothetical protein IKZ92_00240 [Muribaculaceae bacterium]|nr:hypothetical protein [Muribaculaceae bacterium]
MLTDKTKKMIYWTLTVLGCGMTIIALVVLFINGNHDWCRVTMITGISISLLGMVFEPITLEKIKKGRAENIFFLSVLWSIVSALWILLIDNFTPAIIAIVTIDVILLIVDCCLAYRKKQRVKAMEEELENANNEKNVF